MSHKKHSLYCTNCGRTNHDYYSCKDPVTSFGIVLVRADLKSSFGSAETEIKEKLTKKIRDSTSVDLAYGSTSIEIRGSNLNELEVFSMFKDSLSFLLVQRKHTLGYIEFVRGRYKNDNIDGISFLFQQMTPEEIEKIGKYTFDELWNDLWNGDPKHGPGDSGSQATFSKEGHSEYTRSKEKFESLKKEDDEMSLNFYVKNCISAWKTPEWGFPKGRRNKQETDLECATREFMEETGYARDEFEVFENLGSILEDFIGTNGIRYRHVYFIGLDKRNSDKEMNTFQKDEIGNMNFFRYEESIDLIRPYHIARKRIIMRIFGFFINSFS